MYHGAIITTAGNCNNGGAIYHLAFLETERGAFATLCHGPCFAEVCAYYIEGDVEELKELLDRIHAHRIIYNGVTAAELYRQAMYIWENA